MGEAPKNPFAQQTLGYEPEYPGAANLENVANGPPKNPFAQKTLGYKPEFPRANNYNEIEESKQEESKDTDIHNETLIAVDASFERQILEDNNAA